MARHVCEWATRGGERRNMAAYDKGISLGVCRTILVNDAGLIFWCARARRLVYSAAQRARRAVSSLAQWQRLRMWIYVAAPHHTTKPSWGGRCPRGAEANPGVWSKQSSRNRSYYRKTRPRPGVSAHAVPVLQAPVQSPDQSPRAVASQSGPEGPWPTGARWRGGGSRLSRQFMNAASGMIVQSITLNSCALFFVQVQGPYRTSSHAPRSKVSVTSLARIHRHLLVRETRQAFL